MAGVVVVMNPVEVAELMRSPQGPVYRHMIAVATRVQIRAKELVRRRTGNLANTIVKRTVPAPNGFVVEVGSQLPYAFYEHEGTQPHGIDPVRAQVLVFVGRDGSTVFAQHVNHPGTKGSKFLTRAADEVIPAS